MNSPHISSTASVIVADELRASRVEESLGFSTSPKLDVPREVRDSNQGNPVREKATNSLSTLKNKSKRKEMTKTMALSQENETLEDAAEVCIRSIIPSEQVMLSSWLLFKMQIVVFAFHHKTHFISDTGSQASNAKNTEEDKPAKAIGKSETSIPEEKVVEPLMREPPPDVQIVMNASEVQ